MAWSVPTKGTAGTSSAGSNSGQTVSLGTVSVGDVMVAISQRASASNNLGSDTFTDTLSNAWTVGGSWFSSGDGQGGVWAYAPITSGGTCSASSHYTTNSGFDSLCVAVYHSSAGTALVDTGTGAPVSKTLTTAGSGSNNLTSSSITPTVNGCLVVGLVAVFNNTQPTAGTNFTVDQTSTTWPGESIESWTQTTAAAVSATATAGTSANYGFGVMSLTPSGGGGGGGGGSSANLLTMGVA